MDQVSGYESVNRVSLAPAGFSTIGQLTRSGAKPRVISMPAPLCPQVKPGSADRQGSPPLQAWSREDACLFVLSHQGLTHIVHLLPVVGLQTLDCEMHKPRIVS
ncbi:unnamed protein product [Gadus morhua 'NCC']